jgi:hypothetical protein
VVEHGRRRDGSLQALREINLVRTEDLIPHALPPGWELGSTGHLFELHHGKDPHAVVEFLAELGMGQKAYTLQEVE